ncbi:hypothetical protein TNIN_453951, partial [Trichonephila inaurata madagascariensis]
MVRLHDTYSLLWQCKAAFNFVVLLNEDKKKETDDAKSSSGLLNAEQLMMQKDKMEGGMDALKGVGKELEEGVTKFPK